MPIKINWESVKKEFEKAEELVKQIFNISVEKIEKMGIEELELLIRYLTSKKNSILFKGSKH